MAGFIHVLRAGEAFGPAERFTVTQFTTRDGLPQDSVHGLAMDRAGHLWIGTLQGIARYDGHGLALYTHRTTPGMPGAVASLAATDEGTLWMGTSTGLCRLVPDRSRVELEPAFEGYCNRVLSLGNEIVVGGQGGLSHGRAGGVTNVPLPFPVHDLGVTDGSALWISSPEGLWRMPLPWPATTPRWQRVLAGACGFSIATRGSALWVLHGEDLCQLDARTGAVERRWANVGAEPRLADSHGNTWLTSRHPVSRKHTELGVLNADTGRVIPCPSGLGIPLGVTSACMEDPEGTVWLGSFIDGLARLRPKRVDVFDTRHGLPARNIQSVQSSPGAGFWVSTTTGAAHKVGERFEAMNESDSIGGQSILGLSQDAALLAPGHRSLQRVDRRRDAIVAGPEGAHSFFVQRDRSGRVVTGGTSQVWIEAGAGRWMRVPIPEGLNNVVNWQEGPDDEVFLGTLDGGLLHRRGTGAWTQAPLPGAPKAAAVLAWEDSRRPWAGSNVGLYRRRDDGGWDHWTEQHGLAEDLVIAIEPDTAGNLWLLGHRGIHRVSIASLLAVAQGKASRVHTLTLNTRDGLPSNEGNVGTPSSASDPEGNLWFATTRGLVRVRPSAIPPAPTLQPLVTQVLQVGNDALPKPVPHALHPPVVFEDGAGRNLRFQFTAPLPSAGERVRLRYRLTGANAAWTDADASREATFVGLKPGPHQFEVLAAVDDGPWSAAPARWSFVIRPLWWERVDLRAGAVFMMLGAAALVIRRRLRLQSQLAVLRQSRAVENERRRLARDMHDGIGSELARINLAASTHPIDAGEVSRDLLQRLQTLVWLTDPSEDRLDAMIPTLASRVEGFFPSGLPAVQVDIPVAVPTRPVDGRVRRELVAWLDEGLANIARHAAARNVRFHAHVTGADLVLVLADDGRGFDPNHPAPTAGGGHGLANLRARIDALGGRLEIASATDCGTQLKAIIPLASCSPGCQPDGGGRTRGRAA